MLRENLDRYDDIVNPLRPWRSASLVFLTGWAAVLADVLDLPIAGRLARRDGFDPVILVFPFLAVALYVAFWTVWTIGARRQRRRSRALRETLRNGTPPAAD